MEENICFRSFCFNDNWAEKSPGLSWEKKYFSFPHFVNTFIGFYWKTQNPS